LFSQTQFYVESFFDEIVIRANIYIFVSIKMFIESFLRLYSLFGQTLILFKEIFDIRLSAAVTDNPHRTLFPYHQSPL
jgi:hypothetical protein